MLRKDQTRREPPATPQFARKSYKFDVEQLQRLKRIARERSTPTNKVHIAGVMQEAFSEYLDRHDYRNGHKP